MPCPDLSSSRVSPGWSAATTGAVEAIEYVDEDQEPALPFSCHLYGLPHQWMPWEDSIVIHVPQYEFRKCEACGEEDMRRK
jgi:hypothetical protein